MFDAIGLSGGSGDFSSGALSGAAADVGPAHSSSDHGPQTPKNGSSQQNEKSGTSSAAPTKSNQFQRQPKTSDTKNDPSGFSSSSDDEWIDFGEGQKFTKKQLIQERARAQQMVRGAQESLRKAHELKRNELRQLFKEAEKNPKIIEQFAKEHDFDPRKIAHSLVSRDLEESLMSDEERIARVQEESRQAELEEAKKIKQQHESYVQKKQAVDFFNEIINVGSETFERLGLPDNEAMMAMLATRLKGVRSQKHPITKQVIEIEAQNVANAAKQLSIGMILKSSDWNALVSQFGEKAAAHLTELQEKRVLAGAPYNLQDESRRTKSGQIGRRSRQNSQPQKTYSSMHSILNG